MGNVVSEIEHGFNDHIVQPFKRDVIDPVQKGVIDGVQKDLIDGFQREVIDGFPRDIIDGFQRDIIEATKNAVILPVQDGWSRYVINYGDAAIKGALYILIGDGGKKIAFPISRRVFRRWLSKIDDQVRLTDITLPGTHQSGTFRGVNSSNDNRVGVGFLDEIVDGAFSFANNFTSAAAQCQIMTISHQLGSGVRKLDLRFRHFRNELVYHHGNYFMGLSAVQIFAEIYAFLDKYPSEFVVIEMRFNEHTAAENTRSDYETFYVTIFEHLHRWYALPEVNPTVGDMRGKIVWLHRDDLIIPSGMSVVGLNPAAIPKASVDDGGWEFSSVDACRNEKLPKMKEVMVASRSSPHGELFYYTAAGVIPDGRILHDGSPLELSRVLNDGIWSFLVAEREQHAGKRVYGMVSVDFPTEILLEELIRSNFPASVPLDEIHDQAVYGDVLVIIHKNTARTLHSHAINYESGSKQQQVTCFHGYDSNDFFQVRSRHGSPQRIGLVRNQDVIQLTHKNTQRNLHSHPNIHAPITTHQQEVTCYGNNGEGDLNDNWKINLDAETWRVGRTVQFIHDLTNHTLHSHSQDLAPNQQEVTAYANRDANDDWILTDFAE